MTRKNLLIALLVVIVGGAVVAANLYFKRQAGVTVTVEAITARNLEAIVSASGKIQPKRLVNISADTPGRVVNLAVNEGDRVKQGQFLLQIDPKSLRMRVDGGAASVEAAEGTLRQMRQAVETARVQLAQSQRNLDRQTDLSKRQLTTREALEQAQTDRNAKESALRELEHQVTSQESRTTLERSNLDSARYDLSKVRIESPIDGIVTRRNIQEGETAVIGTMNNAGTVLLTLADMSVIQAEVNVDETNIPKVVIGQIAKITIDALPDRVFKGHVTEIGNSPIQDTGVATTATQATNFKVVVVLDEQIPDVRPGFTCTADITTATRESATSVPIPAVAVRELIYDAQNQVVKPPKPDRPRRPSDPPPAPIELTQGQTRRETEGVFVVTNNVAEFVPIKIGVSGDRYFEVLSGLKSGDRVITGPYNSVRNMMDGDPVKIDAPRQTRTSGSTP
ncbi:MAG: efflux RND transporter periplasmic adaptor subunit [Acidobacteriaceae bacterium]|jgi:HlyD family secretion protein|nr:efflux RND transporter periplasmic adaptor subunit [Acidobacteriaceae bacterium]